MATTAQRREFRHEGARVHERKCDREQARERRSHASSLAGNLVYEWEQSLEELNVFIRPPPGVTAAMIHCVISANHVVLGLRGSRDRFLDVREQLEASAAWLVHALLLTRPTSLVRSPPLVVRRAARPVEPRGHRRELLDARCVCSLNVGTSLECILTTSWLRVCTSRPGRADDQPAKDEERAHVAERVRRPRRGAFDCSALPARVCE